MPVRRLQGQHTLFEARTASRPGRGGALVPEADVQLHHVHANARPRRGSSAFSCQSPTMAHLAIVVSETTLSIAIHHMSHCMWRRYSLCQLWRSCAGPWSRVQWAHLKMLESNHGTPGHGGGGPKKLKKNKQRSCVVPKTDPATSPSCVKQC